MGCVGVREIVGRGHSCGLDWIDHVGVGRTEPGIPHRVVRIVMGVAAVVGGDGTDQPVQPVIAVGPGIASLW